jgi:dihydrofolate reductase
LALRRSPLADRLNSATKHVASRTLTSLDWSNSTVLEGEVETAVRELKQQERPELWLMGSSEDCLCAPHKLQLTLSV